MADLEAPTLKDKLDGGSNDRLTTSQNDKKSSGTGPARDSEGILKWANWSDWLLVIGFLINGPLSIYRALVIYRNFKGWENMTMSDASHLLLGLTSIPIMVLIVGAGAPLLYRRFRGQPTRHIAIS
ncbi:hypothetical protein F5Y13DRAFT_174655 [Hypoxylon sp. FL1857]|nr:hypothetical protein F5Y13DRAFT_174655 [Hypoxylon sp. FL1857]